MVISKKFFRLRKNIKVRKGSMRKKFCSLKKCKILFTRYAVYKKDIIYYINNYVFKDDIEVFYIL